MKCKIYQCHVINCDQKFTTILVGYVLRVNCWGFGWLHVKGINSFEVYMIPVCIGINHNLKSSAERINSFCHLSATR